MKKLDFPNLIVETEGELRERERKEKEARPRFRVQLLRLLKSQEVRTLKEAAQICGITPKHAYDLWKKYQQKGLNDYLRLDWKPRQAKLTAAQQQALFERANLKNGFGSQQEVIRYLFDEFGVLYTQGGISLLFERLKIKAKVPRPSNTQASVEEQLAYKKTLPPE